MSIGPWVLLGLERFSSLQSATRCGHSEEATRPEGLEVSVSLCLLISSLSLWAWWAYGGAVCWEGEAITHLWIRMLRQVNSYLHDPSMVLKLSGPLPPWSSLPGYTMCTWVWGQHSSASFWSFWSKNCSSSSFLSVLLWLLWGHLDGHSPFQETSWRWPPWKSWCLWLSESWISPNRSISFTAFQILRFWTPHLLSSNFHLMDLMAFVNYLLITSVSLSTFF